MSKKLMLCLAAAMFLLCSAGLVQAQLTTELQLPTINPRLQLLTLTGQSSGFLLGMARANRPVWACRPIREKPRRYYDQACNERPERACLSGIRRPEIFGERSIRAGIGSMSAAEVATYP